MDIPFRPATRKCVVSGEPLAAGERVVSFLYRDDTGEVQRADAKAAAAEQFQAPRGVICWWMHKVRAPDEEGANRRQAMQSAEELFLALYPGQPEEAAPADDPHSEAEAAEEVPQLEIDEEGRAALRYLLALLLERKRVLKPLSGVAARGETHYRHPKLERTFVVAHVDLTPEQVSRILDPLQLVV